MENFGVKKIRRFAWMEIASPLLAAPPAATSDEMAWGNYAGTCKSTMVSFRLDADGVSSVVLDGVHYPRTELREYGRMGSAGLYEFSAGGPLLIRNVKFLVLFDETEAPRGVTGFYFELARRPDNLSDEPVMTDACTLMMTHVPGKD